MLIRHSVLLAYANAALDVMIQQQQATPSQRRERELVGIAASSAQQQTPWQRLARPLSGATGTKSIADTLVEAVRKGATKGIPEGLRRVMRALEEIKALPTATLTRLTAGTLDVCSHRLDAWVTSLASRRLSEMRATRPTGALVGAFGWIDGLRMAPQPRFVTLKDGRKAIDPGRNGGYIHGPSMRHAAAGAVLRNAHISRADGSRYAITLSSERVRAALDVLDAVREGQALGAVLGQRFERGLRDRAGIGSLQRFVVPLRVLFPLTDGDGSTRHVVHGVRLRDAWRAGRLPFGQQGLPASGPDREALERELARLDEALDGVADLLMAESVYQMIGGGTEAANASLDALARGTRPPDPEVARTPAGGTTLTHRVILVLGAAEGSPATGWPASPTPRAEMEPALDAWVGTILGDPASVRCRVRTNDVAAASAERIVTLADLALRPLDVLALARDLEEAHSTAEMDHRVVRAALGEPPAGADVSVIYERALDWDLTSVRTFPDVLALARSINAVIRGARALRPTDLMLPGETRGGLDPQFAAEALARAGAAEARLARVRDRLVRAIEAVGHQSAPASRPGDLVFALSDAALFGVAAYPRPGVGEATLLAHATAALSEVTGRITAAAAVHGAAGGGGQDVAAAALEMGRALFGRDVVLLPRFAPGTDEADRALDDPRLLSGDGRAPMRWLQQAAPVRPRLGDWQKLSAYARALGARLPDLAVAQLPYVAGARWAALPFRTPTERPPSGCLSLVVHQAGTVGRGETRAGLVLDEWTEVIPAEAVDTGIAFHYDDPGAEAPQTVLLVAPPTDAPLWDLDSVVGALNETLDLAAVRAVDGELLGDLGQLLPGLYLAANVENDTVSTTFAGALINDTRQIVAEK
jgi:hypothetical protein